MLQLEALAHNVLIWARQWLAPYCPKVAHLGIERLVRDAFQMDGILFFDPPFDFYHVVLNQADPLAKEMHSGLAFLLVQDHIAVTLGET